MGDHALFFLTMSIITVSLLVLVEVLYQNLLGIDIATNFVSFVQRQYPDNTKRQVEALHLKLCAFTSMLGRLQPVQKKEAGITANVLLSLIDRMKTEVSPLTMWYCILKRLHSTSMVILLSMREQKRVQEGQWFTLRTNWYCHCKGRHSLCQVNV